MLRLKNGVLMDSMKTEVLGQMHTSIFIKAMNSSSPSFAKRNRPNFMTLCLGYIMLLRKYYLLLLFRRHLQINSKARKGNNLPTTLLVLRWRAWTYL